MVGLSRLAEARNKDGIIFGHFPRKLPWGERGRINTRWRERKREREREKEKEKDRERKRDALLSFTL